MLLAAILIVLAVLTAIAWQVDDWSRDLSTNRAETTAEADDPLLRTLELPVAELEARAAVLDFASSRSNWDLALLSEGADQSDSIHLVRRSKLFGFADDVHVFVRAIETGTQIDITSQSRIGKGDLGQNPRNIRELVRALRTTIP